MTYCIDTSTLCHFDAMDPKFTGVGGVSKNFVPYDFGEREMNPGGL